MVEYLLNAAHEVEFITLTGETVTVARVLPSQLRPVGRRELTHIPELAALLQSRIDDADVAEQ